MLRTLVLKDIYFEVSQKQTKCCIIEDHLMIPDYHKTLQKYGLYIVDLETTLTTWLHNFDNKKQAAFVGSKLFDYISAGAIELNDISKYIEICEFEPQEDLSSNEMTFEYIPVAGYFQYPNSTDIWQKNDYQRATNLSEYSDKSLFGLRDHTIAIASGAYQVVKNVSTPVVDMTELYLTSIES